MQLLHILGVVLAAIAAVNGQCALSSGQYANFNVLQPPQPSSGILGSSAVYSISGLLRTDSCTWYISCGSNANLYISTATGLTPNTGGSVGIWKFTDASSTELKRLYGTSGQTTTLGNAGSSASSGGTNIGMISRGDVTLQYIGDSGSGGSAPTLSVTAYCAAASGMCDAALFSTTAYPTASYNAVSYRQDFPGSIYTDQDGPGTGYLYLNGDRCKWIINCPTGWYVQVQPAFVISTGDSLLMVDALGTTYGALSGTVNGATTYHSIYKSPLTVWFNSTYKTVSSSQTSGGMSMNYACFQSQCSSVSGNSTGFNVGPGGNTPATITSDTDGVGTGTYYAREACVWYLTCPTGWALSITTLQVSTASSADYVRITVNSAATSYGPTATLTSGTALNFVGSDSAMVEFNTDATTNSAGGFTLSFICYSTRCSGSASGTYTGTGTWTTASPYLNNEQCQWTISCGSNAPQFTSVSLNLGAGDALTFYDTNSVQIRQLTGNPGSQPYGATGSLGLGLFPKGSATVTLISDAATTGGSVSVSYTCVAQQSQCSANYLATTYGSPFVVTSTSGSLSNAYPSSYYNNERCYWTLTCPGYSFIRFTGMTVSATTGDYLQITDSTSATFTYTSLSSQSLFFASPVNIAFYSDATQVSTGFTTSYTCMASQCSATDTTFLKTALIGTIRSDADGSGSGTLYSNLESCLWTIQCPSGWKVAITTVSVSTFNSNDYITMIDAGSVTAAYTFYGTQTYSGNSAIDFRTVDSVQFRFITDSTNVGNGFTATYQCYNSQCSSQNSTLFPITWYPGTIWTDPDSYSTSYVARNNERCTWMIQCPTGSFVLIDSLQGQSVGTNDFLKITDALGNSATFSNTLFSRTTITPYSVNRVIVNWWTDSSTQSQGAHFSYNCMVRQLEALPAAPYVPTGFCSGTAYQCSQISAQCSSINTECTNAADPCYQVRLACQQTLSSCNIVSAECTRQSNAFCPNSILI